MAYILYPTSPPERTYPIEITYAFGTGGLHPTSPPERTYPIEITYAFGTGGQPTAYSLQPTAYCIQHILEFKPFLQIGLNS
ncbi:hypothetical protein [Luteirhabdus pelagi]|uniref:hypothetical protein n=1 Tax=Luteirhabdus pelagi TaxID=2792783 RepID=UPI00193A4A71|nr:hypothetical protein [Luteirhabdus pelagi]